MLPEKKKRLIIGIVAVLLIILVVLGLWKLSNYLKSRNNVTDEKSNDAYPEVYSYYGIVKDKDGIYKLYGISDNAEEYLNVRTFYDIKSFELLNDKLMIYSDATNEVRYDKKLDEFYFYVLDDYYSNKEDIKLGDNIVVSKDGSSIVYWKFDSDDKKNVTNDSLDTNYYVVKDKIYYVLNDGIYEYDTTKNEENKVVLKNSYDNVELLNANEEFIFVNYNNNFWAYRIKNSVRVKIEDYIKEEYDFVGYTNSGFMLKMYNDIMEFSLVNNKLSGKTFNVSGYEVTGLIDLGDSNYYMNLTNDNEEEEKSVLVDMKREKIIREFENEYLYLIKAAQ